MAASYASEYCTLSGRKRSYGAPTEMEKRTHSPTLRIIREQNSHQEIQNCGLATVLLADETEGADRRIVDIPIRGELRQLSGHVVGWESAISAHQVQLFPDQRNGSPSFYQPKFLDSDVGKKAYVTNVTLNPLTKHLLLIMIPG